MIKMVEEPKIESNTFSWEIIAKSCPCFLKQNFGNYNAYQISEEFYFGNNI